ncbi:uncharacterized protein LOC116261838 isoform X2 [Nymphaea colorata]|nr:uncharacterized protein LOC116261838 isoform X2 [Nymphaea colorata]
MQSIAVKISSPKPLLYRGFFFARSGFVCSHAARDGAAGDSTLASPFSFSQWTACELSLSVQGNSLSGDHLLFRRQKVLLQRAADPGSFGQLSRMGVLLLLEMLLRSVTCRLCHTDTAGKVKYRRRHADTGIPTRGHRRIRFGSGLGQTRSKPTRFSFKPSFSLYATLPSDSRLSLPRRLPRQHSSAMAGDGDGDIWWRPAAAGDRQYGEERKNSVSVSTYKLWFWRFWISCVYCTATLFETFLLMS